MKTTRTRFSANEKLKSLKIGVRIIKKHYNAFLSKTKTLGTFVRYNYETASAAYEQKRF